MLKSDAWGCEWSPELTDNIKSKISGAGPRRPVVDSTSIKISILRGQHPDDQPRRIVGSVEMGAADQVSARNLPSTWQWLAPGVDSVDRQRRPISVPKHQGDRLVRPRIRRVARQLDRLANDRGVVRDADWRKMQMESWKRKLNSKVQVELN